MNKKLKQDNPLLKSAKPILFVAMIIMNSPWVFGLTYETITIDEKYLSVIDPETFDPESLVVSADESQLCWNASPKKSNLPPIHIFARSLHGSGMVEPIAFSRSPAGSLFTKCAFDENQNYITNEMKYKLGAMLKSTVGYLKVKEWLPIGYQSVVSVYNKKEKIREIDFRQLGISKKAIIEHPRMAPQGRYLAFHTKTKEKDGGIYIYDEQTHQTTLLSEFSDKHPTFNSTGDKLYFHGQSVVNGEERAYLGYYILEFNQNNGVRGKRFLIDPNIDVQKAFIYEKHPSFHEGLELMLFHGREKPDAPKFIGIRSLKNPTKAYKLQLTLNGQTITKSKSPTVAFTKNSALYFIGSQKGKKKSVFFKLSYEGLLQISDAL